ncbi:hypothetical protein Tco_1505067 [Tanacetum coccineum]
MSASRPTRILSRTAGMTKKRQPTGWRKLRKIKYEYLHDNGDVFVDYSWERALSINGDVYSEWCLEFFSMMYFDRGLYEEDELSHRFFALHFTRLEVDDKLFNHEAFWQKIGKPTSTNPRTSLIKEPLMRIVHKLLVGSLVHRVGSNERCQKRDMWMMSALEESQGINLAWVIYEHLCRHASGLKENSLIYGGHYVTKIAHSLGYLNDEENASLKEIKRRDVQRDSMLMRNNYILEHSAPILHHLADRSNYAYLAYEPPNVSPYPYPYVSYPYVPYPHPYTHYPNTASQSFGRDHYGAYGDNYYAGFIVPSFGYEIGGSSVGFHRDDFDLIVQLEDCVESDDDEMRD